MFGPTVNWIGPSTRSDRSTCLLAMVKHRGAGFLLLFVPPMLRRIVDIYACFWSLRLGTGGMNLRDRPAADFPTEQNAN